MVGRKIDPADKRHGGVHHDDLAMQAAKPVGAKTQGLGRRVEHLHRHPGVRQLTEKRRAQLATAKAVEADHHLHATLRRVDQDVLQLMPHLVFEQDKGLQQDFPLRLAQSLEDLREVRLAVFQQLHLVIAVPAVVQVAGLGGVRRLVGGDVFDGDAHSSISTDSGTWSDRWDQGRVLNTRGLCTLRLRT